ncbi:MULTISPECIES: PKD domain-containing protein [unclassified Salinibacterium]|uniref:PKD domain-containing protein n=1 Tax=unclassified Salinibacterium TaxID=2632331 RepID=UPI001E5A1540|nr:MULTISPECIES: PKD domain-containing protein [unclassified Salinibacterium]
MSLILTGAVSAFADESGCGALSFYDGSCPSYDVGDQSIDLSGSTEITGSGDGNFDSGYEADGVAYIPVDDELDSVEEAWCDIQRIECVPWTPPAEDADGETGPITISDIASFRPQAPAAGMQPNQWMIVGLDTNFYATTSAHIVDGTLFGGTAQVRFTPASYNWDYGDGSTATTSNPGKTWAKYRITEFDPTPTSHVFEEPGNYTITLAVTYAAEYRVAGSSWQNVVGTLTIVAPPLTATAGHATTVLVDQDCIANPTGIGC